MKKVSILLILLTIGLVSAAGQRSGKLPEYFGEPIIIDTVSTFLLPILYNEEILSTNKIAFWGDYYANIIAYNFISDTYKKIFSKNVYIVSLQGNKHYSPSYEKIRFLTTKWVFLLVKNEDTNSSGRIDEKDPTVLFAITTKGERLKQLTSTTESVLSLELYEKLGFGLIKIQRDFNGDKSFNAEDNDYYYKKVSLTDLSLGNAIEMN